MSPQCRNSSLSMDDMSNYTCTQLTPTVRNSKHTPPHPQPVSPYSPYQRLGATPLAVRLVGLLSKFCLLSCTSCWLDTRVWTRPKGLASQSPGTKIRHLVAEHNPNLHRRAGYFPTQITLILSVFWALSVALHGRERITTE